MKLTDTRSIRALWLSLVLYALCLVWIWQDPNLRYALQDYTARTFNPYPRHFVLLIDYLTYGTLLSVRSHLNRHISPSLWWVHGLCLVGPLGLYLVQLLIYYPFLSLMLIAQCLVDGIAAFRRRNT